MAQNMDRKLDVVLNQLRINNYEIKTVYDIGANDGRWKYAHSNLFPPHSHFCMFEANPQIQLPNTENQTFFNAVLSYEDDKTVTYYTANPGKENTGNGYYKELTPNYSLGNSIELKTKTLDSLVKENDLPPPQFIKMDTQGSELDILRGGKETFKSAYGVICEVGIMQYNEGAPLFSDYISAFYEYGFVPTGIHHIAMRKNIVNQMDIIFMRKDISMEINKHHERYLGF